MERESCEVRKTTREVRNRCEGCQRACAPSFAAAVRPCGRSVCVHAFRGVFVFGVVFAISGCFWWLARVGRKLRTQAARPGPHSTCGNKNIISPARRAPASRFARSLDSGAHPAQMCQKVKRARIPVVSVPGGRCRPPTRPRRAGRRFHALRGALRRVRGVRMRVGYRSGRCCLRFGVFWPRSRRFGARTPPGRHGLSPNLRGMLVASCCRG